MSDLKIIAITASFGKTSIKNFLHQVLEPHFKTQSTPRSVNTLKGIVQDINNNLEQNTQIYIAELGARQRRDISKIATFLEHHYAILGEVGAAHIEYFKTLDNVLKTKLEIIKSPNLKMLISHYKNPITDLKIKVLNYPNGLEDESSNLDGIYFKLNGHEYSSKILGHFNIENLCAVIALALELGINIDDIKNSIKNLEPVPHRLQKILANGKIILDDSFNGNPNGMLNAFELCAKYNGRKIIITPGLVESNRELNLQIASKIDQIFDLVIITGKLNSNLLSNAISKEKIILKDKTKLQSILEQKTRSGDLILFANDAPNFI